MDAMKRLLQMVEREWDAKCCERLWMLLREGGKRLQ